MLSTHSTPAFLHALFLNRRASVAHRTHPMLSFCMFQSLCFGPEFVIWCLSAVRAPSLAFVPIHRLEAAVSVGILPLFTKVLRNAF